ncbi:MAG: Gar1/Naf1 family protein [Candidatus Bathyarchaeia archaeon]
MIRLGRALHVSPNKNIIVKMENLPKLGETVVDEKLKPVGVVFDIFGPISSPYVAVKPKISKPDVLVGKVLYTFPSKKRREK